MTQSIWEKTGDQIADTAHKATRAAASVTDALEDGVASARLAAKRSGEAASELLDDTKKRVRSHPLESVAATFAAGVATGAAVGYLMRRR